MFKLRKEKMEKIKNVLLQLSSNGNRMTGEIERQRLCPVHQTIAVVKFRRIDVFMRVESSFYESM